ncbi:MAG: threonine synthase [Gammaproteobacteria bacterium]|nr:threonine synthase [Gammaproteobacteria bacterium]
MSYVTHLRCLGCGKEYAADRVMNLCPEDNLPVQMCFDLEALGKKEASDIAYRPERKNMWRFGRLMALNPDNAKDATHIFSLGEGYTPIYRWSDHALAKKAGFELWLKDEGRPAPGFGANPTGSFKDRGMAMVVSMARKFGLEKLAVPTQGNAGDSLAEYASQAGLSAAIAMPGNTPMPILGKVAAYSQLYRGISLDVVEGTIREAGLLIEEKYLPQGYFSVATFQEPGWRIDGKKTLGLELAEPAIPFNDGSWRVPDVIVYPTGGGTGILGMWKAFNELRALGLTDGPMPRMIAVQSEATPPLVRAFEAGLPDSERVEAGDTIAYGLNVPGGVGHFEVLRILRESQGVALAVPEADIGATLGRVFRKTGWWISPEGAACVVAISRLVDERHIRPGDRVVIVNTGSWEKYLPEVRHLL